eukprot:11814997-Alexandrium_andersonii.AAC.1
MAARSSPKTLGVFGPCRPPPSREHDQTLLLVGTPSCCMNCGGLESKPRFPLRRKTAAPYGIDGSTSRHGWLHFMGRRVATCERTRRAHR